MQEGIGDASGENAGKPQSGLLRIRAIDDTCVSLLSRAHHKARNRHGGELGQACWRDGGRGNEAERSL